MSSGESMYDRSNHGNYLAKNIVTSQILGPKNKKYNEPFVNDNLVDTIDHEFLAKNQWINVEKTGAGYCPNFYKGGRDYLEKFTQEQEIEIKLTEKATKKDFLIITNNDLKKLKTKTPDKSGTFGMIYFLEHYDLEKDHLSKDNNKLLKSEIVFKKQTRKFKFGTDVKSAKKCLAFNELISFQKKKSRNDSNLYLNHFYVCDSDKDPTSFDLFIVLKKSELVLSDLWNSWMELNELKSEEDRLMRSSNLKDLRVDLTLWNDKISKLEENYRITLQAFSEKQKQAEAKDLELKKIEELYEAKSLELEETTANFNKIEKQVDDKKVQLSDIENIIEAKADQLKTLNGNLEEAEVNLVDVKKEVDDKKMQLHDIENIIEVKTEELEILDENLEEKKILLSEIESKIAKTRTLERSTTEVIISTPSTICKKCLDNSEDEIRELQKQNDNFQDKEKIQIWMKNKIKMTNLRMANFSHKINQLESKLKEEIKTKTLQSEANLALIEKLQSKYGAAQNELHVLKTRMSKMGLNVNTSDEMEKAQNRVDLIRISLLAAEQKKDKYQKTIGDLVELLKKAVHEKEEIKKKLLESEDKSSHYEALIKNLQFSLKVKQEEAKKDLNDLSILKMRMARKAYNTDNLVQKYEDETKKAQERVTLIEKSLAAAEQKLDKYRMTYGNLENDYRLEETEYEARKTVDDKKDDQKEEMIKQSEDQLQEMEKEFKVLQSIDIDDETKNSLKRSIRKIDKNAKGNQKILELCATELLLSSTEKNDDKAIQKDKNFDERESENLAILETYNELEFFEINTDSVKSSKYSGNKAAKDRALIYICNIISGISSLKKNKDSKKAQDTLSKNTKELSHCLRYLSNEEFIINFFDEELTQDTTYIRFIDTINGTVNDFLTGTPYDDLDFENINEATSNLLICLGKLHRGSINDRLLSASRKILNVCLNFWSDENQNGKSGSYQNAVTLNNLVTFLVPISEYIIDIFDKINTRLQKALEKTSKNVSVTSQDVDLAMSEFEEAVKTFRLEKKKRKSLSRRSFSLAV